MKRLKEYRAYKMDLYERNASQEMIDNEMRFNELILKKYYGAIKIKRFPKINLIRAFKICTKRM